MLLKTLILFEYKAHRDNCFCEDLTNNMGGCSKVWNQVMLDDCERGRDFKVMFIKRPTTDGKGSLCHQNN